MELVNDAPANAFMGRYASSCFLGHQPCNSWIPETVWALTSAVPPTCMGPYVARMHARGRTLAKYSLGSMCAAWIFITPFKTPNNVWPLGFPQQLGLFGYFPTTFQLNRQRRASRAIAANLLGNRIAAFLWVPPGWQIIFLQSRKISATLHSTGPGACQPGQRTGYAFASKAPLRKQAHTPSSPTTTATRVPHLLPTCAPCSWP